VIETKMYGAHSGDLKRSVFEDPLVEQHMTDPITWAVRRELSLE
jgi:hypothetical protein